jgi:hypothetical protein
MRLTMRLSDAGLHQRRTKALYLNHRLPPWFTEAATPRSLEPIVRQSLALQFVLPLPTASYQPIPDLRLLAKIQPPSLSEHAEVEKGGAIASTPIASLMPRRTLGF